MDQDEIKAVLIVLLYFAVIAFLGTLFAFTVIGCGSLLTKCFLKYL